MNLLSSEQNYIPISTLGLIVKSRPGVDIFARAQQDSGPFLLVSHEEEVEPLRVRSFAEGGVYQLLVSHDDYPKYLEHLESICQQFLNDPLVPLPTKIEQIVSMSRARIARSIHEASIDSLVQAAIWVSKHMVPLLWDHLVPLRETMPHLIHDERMENHSLNVACYAYHLGQEVGLSQSELHQLFRGAILHDVGMLRIDTQKWNRKRGLDEQDRKEICRHTLLGFKMLCHDARITRGELMIVYQHHERFDGRGYPVGIENAEIHPWARLCAVVDQFDAQTSKRSHRAHWSPKTAMAIAMRDRGNNLDPTYVDAWNALLHREGALQ